MDAAVYALLAALLYALVVAAPAPARQRMHSWLLSTVGRAPLIFQPMVLLCTPVQSMYRKAHRKSRCGGGRGGGLARRATAAGAAWESSRAAHRPWGGRLAGGVGCKPSLHASHSPLPNQPGSR